MYNIKNLEYLNFPQITVYDDGRVWSKNKDNFLKFTVNKQGYLQNVLPDGNGIYQHILLHRLIALAFIPNPKNKPQVNHIDGVKTNCANSNLEWVTNLENATHTRKNGLMPHNIFDDITVHQICVELEKGTSPTMIANNLECSYDAVYAIRYKRNWNHISKLYNIPLVKKQRYVLTESDTHLICNELEKGKTISKVMELNELFSRDVIKKIRQRKNHIQISKNYNW